MSGILEQAKAIRAAMDAAGSVLDDGQALGAAALYPLWAAGVDYKTGARVRYNGLLYRVLQGHTSLANWTPDAAVSLFVRIDEPGEAWPVWIQPLGAHDAYPLGAQVTHGGGRWLSAVDGNIWEPGIYGWTAG